MTLTESLFNDILQRTYSFDVNDVRLYGGPFIKRTVAGYTTSVTRNVNASEFKQIFRVDEYDSDFGTIAVMMSRDQIFPATKTTDTANTFVIIDPTMIQTGWLQRTRSERLSRDGLRDRFQISAELTLIVRSPQAINGATNVRPNIA